MRDHFKKRKIFYKLQIRRCKRNMIFYFFGFNFFSLFQENGFTFIRRHKNRLSPATELIFLIRFLLIQEAFGRTLLRK